MLFAALCLRAIVPSRKAFFITPSALIVWAQIYPDQNNQE